MAMPSARPDGISSERLRLRPRRRASWGWALAASSALASVVPVRVSGSLVAVWCVPDLRSRGELDRDGKHALPSSIRILQAGTRPNSRDIPAKQLCCMAIEAKVQLT
ncbi:hypothetical protein ZWY2020_035746 [Hordeum vulgare]|nr:hypothetical protein ZWY2020_035746 [Hordeum vulgare]